jgi:adenosylcobinamide kinase/adenosylcobinamide-phosphate guanylyltransferase
MAEIIMITGGARSGKSSHALLLGERLSNSRAFVATCPNSSELDDSELQMRVARHQKERRQRGWRTIEEMHDIAAAIANDEVDLILVDCLTLWVNNLLFAKNDVSEEDIQAECERILDVCRNRQGTVIFVTNEVGCGIVPENALARRYRDLVGRCNQVMAADADQVYLVVSSIPVKIKGDT